MPVARVHTRDIHYFERRVSDSPYPPLVLVHGAGGTHRLWPPQVRRIKGVSTISPDLPGHGASPGPALQSIPEYTSVLSELLDVLHIDRAVVAGHSMGGAVALELALTEPQRVAGLVMVASSARLRVTPAILDNVLADLPGVVDFIMAHGYGPDTSADVLRLGRAAFLASGAEAMQADYLACDAFDRRSDLAAVHVPTLIVAGEYDQMVPSKFTHSLHESIAGSEMVVISGSGHMLPVEFPDDLARITLSWLGRCLL